MTKKQLEKALEQAREDLSHEAHLIKMRMAISTDLEKAMWMGSVN